MARAFKQGYYTPRNAVKYVGDITNIIFRSSCEEKAMQFFDNNPNILRWSSEPIAILYKKPTDNQQHRYFPDFWVEYKSSDGVVTQELLEIKPDKETKPSTSRSNKGRVMENMTYAINISKWTAATQWCQKHGIKFRILTEKQLFK